MILDQTAEISRLRALLRLLAFAAVGDVWVGRDPHAIAAELADVLIESLQLDFAFVHLCGPRGRHQQCVTAARLIARKEIVTNVN
jgi:hypothetical protein